MVFRTDGSVWSENYILCSCGNGTIGTLWDGYQWVLELRHYFGIPRLLLISLESFLCTPARRFWWED